MIQLMSGIAESRLQILQLKIRKLAEDLIGCEASGIEIKHIADADPHPSDAGLAATLDRVVGDAGFSHGNTLAAAACPLQTANPITGNHPTGISRSSRQRIAIGRSPSWLS